jgi:lysophospholipase L1-like esterase
MGLLNIRRWAATALVAAIAVATANGAAAQNALKQGDFVAICGDSITEQKQYSVFIEDYLLMCKPQPDLRAMQFGWSGETSWGFLNKMPTQALRFDMTVATTCYGMNDGGYSPMNDAKAKKYTDAMQGVIDAFKKKGVRFIVVGSPGAVDADTFKKSQDAAVMYNKTLAAERDICKELAAKNGCAFANVHDTMVDAMTKAKAKYGPKYHVAGGDGVHPSQNGQLCMAYAFLKGLGVDGNIGTITVDLAANKAEATDGHKVLGVKDGSVEVESTKYPFCFYGDPAKTGSTSGIIEFLPFNQDLNRLTLVVKGVTGKAKVTWGKNSKEFSAADLEKGINLAAEFIADNPFSEPFKKVEDVIRKQQNAETPLVKKTLNDLPKAKDKAKAEEAAKAEMAKVKEMEDASAAAAMTPVKHTIQIEVVK